MTTEINRKPEPRPESVPEHISRLWATGKLYYVNEAGQIKPFPKPEIEDKP